MLAIVSWKWFDTSQNKSKEIEIKKRKLAQRTSSIVISFGTSFKSNYSNSMHTMLGSFFSAKNCNSFANQFRLKVHFSLKSETLSHQTYARTKDRIEWVENVFIVLSTRKFKHARMHFNYSRDFCDRLITASKYLLVKNPYKFWCCRQLSLNNTNIEYLTWFTQNIASIWH